MDTELLKTLFPAFGAILALVGGVFTYVNGRPREAEGEEDSAVRQTLDWISFALAAGGFVAAVLVRSYVFAVLFFTANFVLQCYMFLRNPSPLRRLDALTLGLLSATFAATLALAAIVPIVDQIVTAQTSSAVLVKQK
jgi:hypothetical protein